MNREELKQLIRDEYGVEPDYPWMKYPDYEVFRHKSNKKWFALIMNVKKSKLGIPDEDELDIVNFKCDNMIMGSFRKMNGFYPAYHMDKKNWISVALDGSVSDDDIIMLLDISYELTL